jgi:hypothetical protein
MATANLRRAPHGAAVSSFAFCCFRQLPVSQWRRPSADDSTCPLGLFRDQAKILVLFKQEGWLLHRPTAEKCLDLKRAHRGLAQTMAVRDGLAVGRILTNGLDACNPRFEFVERVQLAIYAYERFMRGRLLVAEPIENSRQTSFA